MFRSIFWDAVSPSCGSGLEWKVKDTTEYKSQMGKWDTILPVFLPSILFVTMLVLKILGNQGIASNINFIVHYFVLQSDISKIQNFSKFCILVALFESIDVLARKCISDSILPSKPLPLAHCQAVDEFSFYTDISMFPPKNFLREFLLCSPCKIKKQLGCTLSLSNCGEPEHPISSVHLLPDRQDYGWITCTTNLQIFKARQQVTMIHYYLGILSTWFREILLYWI